MSTASTTFTDLDPEVTGVAAQMLRQKLQEYRPNVDMSPSSVISQLVVGLTAPAQSLAIDGVRKLEESWSLSQLSDETDPEIVDRLLSNYFVERRPATAAFGRVKLTLSGLVSTAVSSSARFVRNGVTYAPDSSYFGVVSEESLLASTDRLIRLQQDGTYAMSIDVTCTTPGSSGKLLREDQLTLVPAVSGVVAATVEADFSEGEDEESTESLRQRMLEGVSADVPASRASIRSMIRKSVPATVDVSVIGYGDPELTRGSRNLLGIQLPGKVDVYVRTATVPDVSVVEMDAVLDSKAGKVWRLVFPRTVFPGAYAVESVKYVETEMLGTLEILSTERGTDAEARDGLFAPTFETGHQSVFTPYQTLVVRFADPATAVTSLTENSSTKSYRVSIRHMPDLWKIQSEMFSSRDARLPGVDCLVRAPFPCYVSAQVTIRHPSPDTVSAETVASHVAAAINAVPFSWSSLPASEIVRAAQEKAGGGYVDLPVRLSGVLVTPTGDTVHLEGRDGLEVAETEEGVSRRTTAFYALPGSVSVTVLSSERTYV